MNVAPGLAVGSRSCVASRPSNRSTRLLAAVVVTSLVLELALHGVAQEAVALLVFFRLVSRG